VHRDVSIFLRHTNTITHSLTAVQITIIVIVTAITNEERSFSLQFSTKNSCVATVNTNRSPTQNSGEERTKDVRFQSTYHILLYDDETHFTHRNAHVYVYTNNYVELKICEKTRFAADANMQK